MASRKKSLYEILGVPRDASTGDIDAAYERRKAELDGAGSTDPNAMALLRDARDALRNPARRAAYDATLTATEAREAAEEKAAKDAPPVVIEDEAPPERKPPWLPIGIVIVVLLVIVVAMSRTGKPETAEKHTEAMPGTTSPTPAPPPPPAKKSGVEVIAEASTSGGQVLSYSMSGQAIPVGLAVSTEPGTMVTTCHGLPAGAKLVVRVQEQSYPADLLTTDEVLDLCRLQVAGFSTRPVKVATVSAKAGDAIFAVGVDAAGKYAATSGTVKSILDTVDGKLLELSMPVGQFSSGGGVFNEAGELVGIQMFQHRSGLSVAYPASWIAEMKSRQRAAAEPAPAATPPAPAAR